MPLPHWPGLRSRPLPLLARSRCRGAARSWTPRPTAAPQRPPGTAGGPVLPARPGGAGRSLTGSRTRSRPRASQQSGVPGRAADRRRFPTRRPSEQKQEFSPIPSHSAPAKIRTVFNSMSTGQKDRPQGFKLGFELVCFAVYGLKITDLIQYIYVYVRSGVHRFIIVLAVNAVFEKCVRPALSILWCLMRSDETQYAQQRSTASLDLV